MSAIAAALYEALRRHLTIETDVVHEGLTLLQQDRNGAWFAEPDGARLLICSAIGTEGRIFQFAPHLVFFDLPLNPELLEQRIGWQESIGRSMQRTRCRCPPDSRNHGCHRLKNLPSEEC